MKPAFYGRIVFGASAVLFGVMALMWHDPDTWQNLHHIWGLPLGAVAGECLMAALIAGGIGMQFPQATRIASIVLCMVYLCFALACVPDIVAATNTYEKYGGSFFLFLSLFFGAIAVFASTEADARIARALGRAARLGLGVCAISFTLGQALLLRDTAQAVPKWIPPSQMFWAVFTTIAFALAAIAILIDRGARPAMRLLTLMLGLFALLVWAPRVIALPRVHFLWSELAETLLVTGAAWMVAELRSF